MRDDNPFGVPNPGNRTPGLRAGRPRIENARREVLSFAVSKAEKEALIKEAASVGKTMGGLLHYYFAPFLEKLNTPTTMTLTPESIKGMSASLLADAILGTCEAMRVELKAAHGGERFNQAAAQRARVASRQLEKLCKAYRKASVK